MTKAVAGLVVVLALAGVVCWVAYVAIERVRLAREVAEHRARWEQLADITDRIVNDPATSDGQRQVARLVHGIARQNAALHVDLLNPHTGKRNE